MINDGLPQDWPPAVAEAVDLFKQGHLVEAPPLFYVATPSLGIWDLTRQEGDVSKPRDLLDLDGEFLPPFGLITTQTCDIADVRKKPWFQVAPVYELTPKDAEKYMYALKRDEIIYWVLLGPPTLSSGVWIADLRIEMPIEKSWLAGRIPIESFETEVGYIGLAQRLAFRLARAAFHDTLVATQRSLASWFSGAPEEAKMAVEVRIYVTPDRLEPQTAGLLILTEAEPLPQTGRDQWMDWWSVESERMAAAGVALLPNQFGELSRVTALEYRKSVHLELGS